MIRLKDPLPCKEGRVKVTVMPQPAAVEPSEANQAALQALDRLLGDPDELSPDQWAELERVIQEHPLRIRRGASR